MSGWDWAVIAWSMAAGVLFGTVVGMLCGNFRSAPWRRTDPYADGADA